MVFSGQGEVVIPIRGDSGQLVNEIIRIQDLTAQTARRLSREYDISLGQAARIIRQKRGEIQQSINSTVNGGQGAERAGREYGDNFIEAMARALRGGQSRIPPVTPNQPPPPPLGAGSGGDSTRSVFLGNLQAQAVQAGTQLVGNVARGATEQIRGSLDLVRELDEAVTTFQAKAQASDDQVAALEEEAKRLGATTTQTATEVGNLGADLAALGFGAEGTVPVLEGIVLATEATGENLTEVGQTVAGTINAFSDLSKTQEDALRVADIFTAGINNSALTIAKLNQGIATSGATASGFNQTLETTTAVLGVLANNNIRAESAATAYKNVLISLAAPNARATEAINELQTALGRPINIRNEATGELNQLTDILPELTEAFDKLDPAKAEEVIVKLVGREALSGFSALINNTEQFNELLGDIVNSSGDARTTQEQRLQSIGSQIDLLTSATSGIQLNLGESLEPLFTGIIQFVTRIAQKLAETEGLFDGIADAGQGVTDLLAENEELADRIATIIAGSVSGSFQNLGDTVTIITDTLRENPEIIEEILNRTERWLTFINDAGTILTGIFDIIGKISGAVASVATAEIPILSQLPGIEDSLAGILGQLSGLGRLQTGVSGLAELFRGQRDRDEPEAVPQREVSDRAQEMADLADQTEAATEEVDNLNAAIDDVNANPVEVNIEDTLKGIQDATQRAVDAANRSQVDRLSAALRAELADPSSSDAADIARIAAEAELESSRSIVEAKRSELAEINNLRMQGLELTEEALNRERQLTAEVGQDTLNILQQELALREQIAEQEVAEQFAPRLIQNEQQSNNTSEELGLLQARSALANELNQLEEQRLQSAISIAQTRGQEVQASQLAQQLEELQLQNTIEMFGFKREELRLEQQITELAARRSVLEAERELQLAQRTNASAEELATLQGIVDAREQELGILGEQFRLQNQLLDTQEQRAVEAVEQQQSERRESEAAAAAAEAEAEAEEESSGSSSSTTRTTSSSGGAGGGDIFDQITSNIDNPLVRRVARDDLENSSSIVSTAGFYGQGSSGGLAAQRSELETDLLRNALNEFQGLAANAAESGTQLSRLTIQRFEDNIQRIVDGNSRPSFNIIGTRNTSDETESLVDSIFSSINNNLSRGGGLSAVPQSSSSSNLGSSLDSNVGAQLGDQQQASTSEQMESAASITQAIDAASVSVIQAINNLANSMNGKGGAGGLVPSSPITINQSPQTSTEQLATQISSAQAAAASAAARGK